MSKPSPPAPPNTRCLTADAVLSSQAEKAVTLMNGMIRDGEARLFAGAAGAVQAAVPVQVVGPGARDSSVASVLGVPPLWRSC